MPTGPNGERRPADPNGIAVLVGKIATRQVEEQPARRAVLQVDKPAKAE